MHHCKLKSRRRQDIAGTLRNLRSVWHLHAVVDSVAVAWHRVSADSAADWPGLADAVVVGVADLVDVVAVGLAASEQAVVCSEVADSFAGYVGWRTAGIWHQRPDQPEPGNAVWPQPGPEPDIAGFADSAGSDDLPRLKPEPQPDRER